MSPKALPPPAERCAALLRAASLFPADVRRRGVEIANGTSLVANLLAAIESSGSRITDEVRIVSNHTSFGLIQRYWILAE